MWFRVAADVTMTMHFLFIGYVVVGGFLAWRWRWTLLAHVAAVAWGFSTVLFDLTCPLTSWENTFREKAGEAGLPPSGFIDHYLTGVIYPRADLGLIRALVVVAVLVSWMIPVVGSIRRRRAARRRTATAHPDPAR
jgi:hypothetical protein